MSPHLSSSVINKYLIGEPNRASRLHLRECPHCRAKIAQTTATLEAFRASAKEWSAEERVRVPDERRRAIPRSVFAAAGAVFALLLAAAVLFLPLRQIVPTRGADAALLTHIHTELFRTVPSSMTPLTKLIALNQRQKTEVQ